MKESSETVMRSAIFGICGKSMKDIRMELMQTMRSIILSFTLGYNTYFSQESPKIQKI
jgi:hypothetical protein